MSPHISPATKESPLTFYSEFKKSHVCTILKAVVKKKKTIPSDNRDIWWNPCEGCGNFITENKHKYLRKDKLSQWKSLSFSNMACDCLQAFLVKEATCISYLVNIQEDSQLTYVCVIKIVTGKLCNIRPISRGFGMVVNTQKPLKWDECATQREHTSLCQLGF